MRRLRAQNYEVNEATFTSTPQEGAAVVVAWSDVTGFQIKALGRHSNLELSAANHRTIRVEYADLFRSPGGTPDLPHVVAYNIGRQTALERRERPN